ncbi:MAG: 3-deoxy-7-phosphoheptulonate synthase [Candidatus Eremiobacteraeota bacterium]|jgi:3-deoxy-7-phosphoheptulonate synthase|nr:3-deoxy-7-phosphoheptulonate synthase [Candidatus Eremiobacteraeota bacterium]MCL5054465.1 3-deoxy-7-phosphoheptulonate synthase [Bacillota bacterium]
MIIVMKPASSSKELEHVIKTIHKQGFKPHVSKGEETTIIGVIGDERKLDPVPFQLLPGVDRVIPVLKPFKLASRDFKRDDTVIKVNGIPIGGGHFTVIAGPCAVESLEQVMETAKKIKGAGAVILRGGAYKPRTSPYSFQGLGPAGLKILAEAKKRTGLAIITEVMSEMDLPLVAETSDILQIGARNMQNFALLDAAGKQKKPILLKRGLSSTIEEFLLSAEYILSRGNYQVILCERGIRTFEKSTRNTLDISAVPVIKKQSHLPVILDPSHAAGYQEYVSDLAYASAAVGADGIMIEVHPHPEKAFCDGQESLTPEQFKTMMIKIKSLVKVMGKRLNKVS